AVWVPQREQRSRRGRGQDGTNKPDDAAPEAMMLNEYAEAVRARLVAAFPEFAGHVGEEGGHFVIQYPSTDPDFPLYVWTYDDEITVGFDMWHMHIPCMDDDVDAEVAEAAGLIRAILEGRTLVVVKHAGETWTGSHLASSPEEV